MSEEPVSIFRDIRDAIARSRCVLITSHRDCDGDSVGGQLAMAGYATGAGREVTVSHHGPVPAALAAISGVEQIIDASSSDNINQLKQNRFDLVIVLECSELARVGDVRAIIPDSAQVINIDHHADNTGYGDIRWLDAGASSVCEMLARFFAEVGYDYGLSVAECLYVGIMTDTGRFRFNSVTPLTFSTTAEVVSRGIDIQEICDRIYFSRSPASLRLAGYALEHIQFSAHGRICVIAVTLEMMQKAGAVQSDTEGLVDYTLMGEGALLGAFIRENGRPGAVKVSLRSRGDLDVSSVASVFGGGGHRNAAGCAIEGSIESATLTITAKLEELLSKSSDSSS